MWNPFRREPPPPMFDPFEVAEETARLDARIAEMGAAERRLIKATKEARNTIKESHKARQELDQSIAGARRQRRGVGGRTW
jgi:hypothetical protein